METKGPPESHPLTWKQNKSKIAHTKNNLFWHINVYFKVIYIFLTSLQCSESILFLFNHKTIITSKFQPAGWPAKKANFQTEIGFWQAQQISSLYTIVGTSFSIYFRTEGRHVKLTPSQWDQTYYEVEFESCKLWLHEYVGPIVTLSGKPKTYKKRCRILYGLN